MPKGLIDKEIFRFKQFSVRHRDSAMKVGTDGVLLGCWASIPQHGNVLDIGTGTGLIALIVAQRSGDHVLIEGIDNDRKAFKEAEYNFNASPWQERLNIRDTSLQEFQPDTTYDLIITNPPFFRNENQIADPSRARARISENLEVTEIFKFASRHLRPNGLLALVYPYDQKIILEELAIEHSLYITRATAVKPKKENPRERILLEFRRYQGDLVEDELTIQKIKRNDFTDEFIELTKDFYLNL